MIAVGSSSSKATVDQSISLPDFFSCQNCHGWKSWHCCQELRAEGLCAKQMLRAGLATGAVQVHLFLPAVHPSPLTPHPSKGEY